MRPSYGTQVPFDRRAQDVPEAPRGLVLCLLSNWCAAVLEKARTRLMPGISQRRFYATVRAPSSEALDILSPHSREILSAWQRQIQILDLQPNELVAESLLDFGRLAELLRKSTYPVFRQAFQKFGEQLASRKVSLARAVAAVNRLYEVCLPYIVQRAPRRATPVLALGRLHALVSLLMVSGYTGQWAGGKKNLVEASLAEAEDRRHEASAYVTRIYEQERRRLSQDLHDEVGHDLMLAKLYLEMIAMENREELAGVQPRVAEAIALVSHAIDSVRRLILDLGPAVFEDLGFLPAVRTYISQFSARTKINVTLHAGYLPSEIPSSHQVALYRLLQGALSNVLKHAAAKSVKVSLGSMKDSVVIMVIEDDGIGFDATAQPGRRSFGLTAMRERVEVLGGKIHIHSKVATPASKVHGTRIEIDLPLPGGDEK